MMRNKQFQWVFVLVSLACILGLGIISMQGTLASTFRTNVVLKATFTLDNVPLSVQSSLLPSAHFGVSDPGAAMQQATAVVYIPYQELQIITVPYGFRSATEEVPMAQPGQETSYQHSLYNFRVKQGGNPQPGPIATLFGKRVTSEVSHVQLHLNSLSLHLTVIVEWVVEAGNRLWIIRFSAEEIGNDTSLLNSISSLVIGSSALNQPTTIGKLSSVATHNAAALSSASNLPAPKWWNGDTMCDKTSYLKNTGATPFILHDANGVKAIYRGVQACGPLPYSVSTPDNYVQFIPNPNNTIEQEWECAELVKRYLLLAYDLPSVAANGSQVVSTYYSTYQNLMNEVPNNGTPHVIPSPGDIFSYGDTSTSGHTSIVTSVTITDNVNGIGTVTIIDQNGSATGMATHQINSWVVNGSNDGGTISAWLTPRTWSITPSPSWNHYATPLNSVSATSVTDAWAVGPGLIEHWDGNKWKIQSKPGGNLLSVASISSTDAWAVGEAGSQILTEHWNGSKWKLISSPNFGDTNTLYSVSAVNSTDVWAVGASCFTNGGCQTLTEQWNGSQWSIVSSPNGALGGFNVLEAVTTIASNDIWAVGYDYSTNGPTQTLTMNWNGSQWTIFPSPNPGGTSASNDLFGVTGVASNDVWVVGTHTVTYPQTLTEHWDGSNWSVIPSPNVGINNNFLNAVTERSVNDVWAVGHVDTVGDTRLTLIEHWDGIQWNILPSPNSKSFPQHELLGIALTPNPSWDVWAVGMDYNNQLHTSQPLIEYYS